MNKAQEQLEKLFAPDIQVKLDKDSIIISYQAITEAGAYFILHNGLILKEYDEVLQNSFGLCFEVTGKEE